MSFLKSLILTCIIINLSFCCNIIRYKKNDLETIYKQVQNLKCFNSPVYRLTMSTSEKPFYIYKSSSNNSIWCDSFIPNESKFNCLIECNELRFNFDQLIQDGRVVPQQFDRRFSKWLTSKQNDTILTCDNSLNRAEMVLDELLSKLKLFRDARNLTNLTQLNELITNTVESMNNAEKMRFLNDLLASSKDKATTSNNLSMSQTSCNMIEYQIFDENNRIKFASKFLLLNNDVKCFDSPVYKSTNGLYIYKSVNGEWCKTGLRQFDARISCMERCIVRLGPNGIRSPLDAKLIEILNEQTNSYDPVSNSHRFICADQIDCSKVNCQNGGTCNLNDLKCTCPPHFTGSMCEYLLDSCISSSSSSLNTNKCLNGGTCLSKPYDNQIECLCDQNHFGNLCQFKIDNCMRSNPCKNDGQCISEPNGMTSCVCTENYYGEFCQLQKTYCKNRNFGDLVADPESKSNFLVCLNSGHFKLKSCPVGLVWNSYKMHCDYDDKEPEHSCQTNICKNGGTCEKIDNNFKCHCQIGFSGENCEINIDDCDNGSRCGPNGKCIDLVNGHVCICDENFFGPDCLKNRVKIPCRMGIDIHTTRYSYPFDSSVIVECNNRGNLVLNKCPKKLHWNPLKASCTYEPLNMSNDCLKQCVHGKCELDADKMAQCVCEKGYEGEFCEKNINECASSPCMNNSKCVDGIGSYFCSCENKFLDKDCCCMEPTTLNPCQTVMRDINTKKDKTVRHSHPYTHEKFIVCNLEGFGQVINCPDGLVWSETEQSCAAKDENIYQLLKETCDKANALPNPKSHSTLFQYPYSKYKYVHCNPASEINFNVRECPKKMPYFCDKSKNCVQSLSKYC